MLGVAVSSPADLAEAAQSPTSCPANPVSIVNGGFENPVISGAWGTVAGSGTYGWSTNDPNNLLEIWRTQTTPFQGNQSSELQAFGMDTIYQTVATVPGTTLRWRLRHQGRSGPDTANVRIGLASDGLASPYVGANFSDPAGTWVQRKGTYLVPANQTSTFFGVAAIAATGGNNSAGNLIDDVAFGTAPCLITTKSMTDASGTPIADLATLPYGSVVNYTINSKNYGGDYTASSVITDTIPTWLTYSPGTLKIDGVAQTDAADTDTGKVSAGVVTANVGNYASSTSGGEIGNVTNTPGGVTVTFRATVNAQANGTITNNATLSYIDPFEPAVTLTSTSNDVRVTAYVTDLRVTKTANPTSLQVGQNVAFTMTVTNAGPAAVVGAPFTDALPAGLTGAAWTCAPAAACSATSGTGSVATNLTLAANATATITLNATVGTNATATNIDNTASVVAPANVSETSTANNSATVDLALTTVTPTLNKTSAITPDTAPAGASIGDTITYR